MIPKKVVQGCYIRCAFLLPLKNEKSANEKFADFSGQHLVVFGRGTGS
jgi:hypothetical protein